MFLNEKKFYNAFDPDLVYLIGLAFIMITLQRLLS